MELSLDLIKYMLSDQAGNGNGDDFLIGLALAGASTESRVVTDSPQAGPYNALPRKQVSSASTGFCLARWCSLRQRGQLGAAALSIAHSCLEPGRRQQERYLRG